MHLIAVYHENTGVFTFSREWHGFAYERDAMIEFMCRESGMEADYLVELFVVDKVITRWDSEELGETMHRCDGCDTPKVGVQSRGRDANGEPDAPDLCEDCYKKESKMR